MREKGGAKNPPGKEVSTKTKEGRGACGSDVQKSYKIAVCVCMDGEARGVKGVSVRVRGPSSPKKKMLAMRFCWPKKQLTQASTSLPAPLLHGQCACLGRLLVLFLPVVLVRACG
jgi:hypothetical protein